MPVVKVWTVGRTVLLAVKMWTMDSVKPVVKMWTMNHSDACGQDVDSGPHSAACSQDVDSELCHCSPHHSLVFVELWMGLGGT